MQRQEGNDEHTATPAAPFVVAFPVDQAAQGQPMTPKPQLEIPGDPPDRAACSSAPPDLEISSRSLFAFKAGYSDVFSDIRYDEHYESFYNNFPDKDKLPPPLDCSVVSNLQRSEVSMRRTESDASVDDLIFREARKMRPRSSNNLIRDDSVTSLSSLTRNMSEASVDDIARDQNAMEPGGLFEKSAHNHHDASAFRPFLPLWYSGENSKFEDAFSLHPGSTAGSFHAERHGPVSSGHPVPVHNARYQTSPFLKHLMNENRIVGTPYASQRVGLNVLPEWSRPAVVRASNQAHQDRECRVESRRRSPERGSLVDRHGDVELRMREIASSSIKYPSLDDLKGRIVSLAKDQYGCRYLQCKLEDGEQAVVDLIFHECYETFVELMTEPFANYLVQKLFEHCDDSQRLLLVKRCSPSLPSVCVNMHGTRAVQRMIDFLSTSEQISHVCASIAPSSVSLMKDINGNHCIQRCLQRIKPPFNQFIYDAALESCCELSCHRHGCCVIQRCLDFASPVQRKTLVERIILHSLVLVQNPFGNYVVQYVLDLSELEYTSAIVHQLEGNLVELSVQKFSSNVVEKCFQKAEPELRCKLIAELISRPDMIRRLLLDSFGTCVEILFPNLFSSHCRCVLGNYVIQRALQLAETPQFEQLCDVIRPHLPCLKASPYGKRIQSKILKRFPKMMPNPTPHHE